MAASLRVRTERVPDSRDKAAALTHSIARDHALVDGNKRLAHGGTIAFFGVNGRRPTLTNDQAHDLIIAISPAELGDVPDIANRIRAAIEDRRQ
jgi:death on curing protein